MAIGQESSKKSPPLNQPTGQYYLLEKIAQGGMAEIFRGLAYDEAGIKKTVCIKKILPHIAASQEFIDMLVDEAKIAVQLNHGNIAQIFDLGKVDDDYFIVMEFVDGYNLSKLNKKALKKHGKLSIPSICYIIAEIANGLNYMHRKTDELGNNLHIIHRDISPQNIVLSFSGTIKIIDFGIAKAASSIGHTESGILKGKFAYMSPEQARGDIIDHRSDIFSLGIILHELLTQKRLFKGKDNQETLRNVRRAHILAPSKFNSEVSEELDTIALRALSKDKEERFEHASDFRDSLMKLIYSQYADFKPARLADLVRDLFHDEIKIRQEKEAEIATPHLILDKTHSAVLVKTDPAEDTFGGKSPDINWREFMLELEWPDDPIEKEEISESLSEKSAAEEVSQVSEISFEPTEETNVLKESRFSKMAPYLALLSGILVLLLLMLPYLQNKWEVFFTPKAENLETNSLPVIEPPSKPALLIIESSPAGAEIFLDDQSTGLKTPATLGPFDNESTVKLGIHLEKYKYYESTIKTYQSETQRFHIQLSLNYGALKILSSPAGGMVLLNGKSIGTTPIVYEQLPPEEIFNVSISLNGYKPWHKQIKIGGGKELLLSATLEAIKKKVFFEKSERDKELRAKEAPPIIEDYE